MHERPGERKKEFIRLLLFSEAEISINRVSPVVRDKYLLSYKEIVTAKFEVIASSFPIPSLFNDPTDLYGVSNCNSETIRVEISSMANFYIFYRSRDRLVSFECQLYVESIRKDEKLSAICLRLDNTCSYQSLNRHA